eukprot:CAMPEP_0195284484 /NCGR_PEP_ID=MMETSP0707-20130614/2671_1 /TAXON_ID=33640 /ORGANISM="Asterionellopsis glacialis, Strain CCMP134" /LENGTH=289 /DNA_ID=CAMNT_0040343835 /DNA_START=170 /DNA_END=1039 /DNA_ORIENTATION=-
MSEPRRSTSTARSFLNTKNIDLAISLEEQQQQQQLQQQQGDYEQLLNDFTDIKVELAEAKTDLGNTALQLRKMEHRNQRLEKVEERNMRLQEKLCRTEQENDGLRNQIKQLEKKVLLSTMAMSSSSRHSRVTTAIPYGASTPSNLSIVTPAAKASTDKLRDSSYSTRTTVPDDASLHSQYSSMANKFVYVPSHTPMDQKRIPEPCSNYSTITNSDIWPSAHQNQDNDDDNCSKATSSRIRDNYYDGDDGGGGYMERSAYSDNGDHIKNNDLEAVDLSDPFAHLTEVDTL